MTINKESRILILLIILFSCAIVIPAQEDSPFLKREVKIGKDAFGYRVFLPKNHNPKIKFPVMLYLHNNGANGTDNEKQIVGFDKLIASNSKNFNFIVVFPQARPNSYWVGTQTEQAVKALDQTVEEFNGDTQRLYLAGHSLGGYGTWTTAVMYPHKFAALVPIAGGIVPPFALPPIAKLLFPKQIIEILDAPNPYDALAERIGNTPVWIFHGAKDESIPVKESRQIFASLQKQNSKNVKFTEYPETDHNAALFKAFSEPELFKWLGKQELKKLEIAKSILDNGSVAQSKSSSRTDSLSEQITPKADHHQHLFSPAMAEFQKIKPITAQDVIKLLDQARIKRAVLLSTAFSYGRPGREPENEYEKVKEENDWVAAQAALFPKRLMAFCSFNPLKDYALDELNRCAKDPNLRYGIKLHFGNSDVQLENPEHSEKLKKVFQAANERRMAIVVHMRASFSQKRPYGPEQARAFLKLLSFVPDIPVQVAHMASSGPGFEDPPAHSVIEVLAKAVEENDPRTRDLWFDVTTVAHPEDSAENAALLVKLIRQIGVKRILYGSDAAVGPNPNLLPREAWEAFCRLELTKKEIKTIAGNVAPYLRRLND